MPKYIEPYFAFEVLGIPMEGAIGNEGVLEFLRWLEAQDLSVKSANKIGADAVAKRALMEFERTPKEMRTKWGYVSSLHTFFIPHIQMPEETDGDLFVNTWLTEQCARANVTTSLLIKVPLESYNPIAEYMRRLALAMHQKMAAKVSVGGGFDKILFPYNNKTAPLWVGWFSIYSKEVQERYNLTKDLSVPESIHVEEKGDDLVFTSGLPFSEYIMHGWDSAALTFWEGVGGKILDKPAGKKRKKKDDRSETYIVDSVDKETGIATLKPFSLKK